MFSYKIRPSIHFVWSTVRVIFIHIIAVCTLSQSFTQSLPEVFIILLRPLSSSSIQFSVTKELKQSTSPLKRLSLVKSQPRVQNQISVGSAIPAIFNQLSGRRWSKRRSGSRAEGSLVSFTFHIVEVQLLPSPYIPFREKTSAVFLSTRWCARTHDRRWFSSVEIRNAYDTHEARSTSSESSLKRCHLFKKKKKKPPYLTLLLLLAILIL